MSSDEKVLQSPDEKTCTRRTMLERSLGAAIAGVILGEVNALASNVAPAEQQASTSPATAQSGNANQAGVRVIVTANNEQGKSYVLADKRVTRGGDASEIFGTTFQNPFGTGTGPLSGVGEKQATLPSSGLLKDPPPGGSRLAYVGSMPPGSQTRDDKSGWHITATIDYVLMLGGEVTMYLDEGDGVVLHAGDVVIQRNTHHAWRNYGKTPASWLAVLLPIDHP
jgi:hypothetical protein